MFRLRGKSMLYFQNLQYRTTNLAALQTRNWASTCLMLIAVTALFMMPDMAHAAGLSKATTGMENFLEEIKPIIRIVAIISIIGAGAGYMANMVDKSMFVKIIAGIIIIASASEIVNFFWT
jgi:type IV secretory pathway VirB2 component (pilin)